MGPSIIPQNYWAFCPRNPVAVFGDPGNEFLFPKKFDIRFMRAFGQIADIVPRPFDLHALVRVKRAEKVMTKPVQILCAGISNLMLLLGSSNFQAATKRKLSDRALNVELDPGHLCEQIDIGRTDRTSAKPHICRD